MAGKRVLLTLNSQMHEELKKKSKNNLMTIQEYITNIVRKDILSPKSKKKTKIFFFFLFLLLVASTVNAAVIDREIEEKLNSGEEVSVIVMLEDQQQGQSFLNSEKGSLKEKKQMIQNQQKKVFSKLNLEDKKGFFTLAEPDLKLNHRYSTVNGFSGKLTRSGFEKLKNDPNVKSISINKQYHITLDQSIPQINADDTWKIQINSTNITGAGETICIIDTGIDYNHSALGSVWGNKVIGGYDFVNNDNDPMDDHGHGTHVAGIAASTDSIYRGVAPDAKIIAIKSLDSSGNGYGADIIAGIDWCTANASTYNISIISMSLGDTTAHNIYCDNDNLTMTSAINTAVGQNISIMIASGNCEGVSCTSGISAPACIENATPIGAVNDADSINYQRGILLQLLAPGVNIYSTKRNGGFISSSGTSMSTPHAAGAAALLQQYNKLKNGNTLTPAQIENILNDTGVSLYDSGTSRNYSRIDVYAAVQSLNDSYQISDSCSESNITFFLEPYIMSWNETAEIIRFETDQAVNATSEYGKTTDYNLSISNSSFSKKHELMLNNLTPNTLYYYKVTVQNISNSTCYQNSVFNSSFRTSQDSKKSFSFAVLGDSRDDGSCGISPILPSLLQSIASKGVDFVIITGDTTNANYGCDYDLEWKEFHNSSEIIRKNTSILCSPGNHEDVHQPSARVAWRNYWIHPLNGNGLAGEWNETTYMWRYGNSLFISVNTYETGNAGNITGAQFTWFNETALTQTGYTHKFVFGHHPLVGSTRSGNLYVTNPSRSAMIDNEMYSKNITAAFYGHDHYYCYNTTQDGDMLHIIAGGGGAPLYSTSTCLGTGISQYHYILVNVSDKTINGAVYNLTGDVIHTFSRTMSNTPPVAANVTLSSTDSLNRTNGTLHVSWDFYDEDGDNQIDNKTKWYNNSIEIPTLVNLTSIDSENTTRGETWIFSVRVYDGYNWSDWTNSSSIIIQNTPPEMGTISDININTTEIVNITVNATDLDLDNLVYSLTSTNSTNFTQLNNIFTWQTTMNDSGIYIVNITVSDNSSNISQLVTITICLDNDGDTYGNGCSAGPDCDDNDDSKYPGAPCSRTCYSGSIYDANCTCTGGTYTCGGGGGGGGGGTTTSKTYNPNLEAGEYRNSLSRKDKINFQFKTRPHSATVSTIASNYVDLIVESTPLLVTVYESETEKIDLDNDAVYDLSITLNDIIGSKADLTFKLISEPIFEIFVEEIIEENITENITEINIIEEINITEEAIEEPILELPKEKIPSINRLLEFLISKESIIYIVLIIFILLFIILIIVKFEKKRFEK
ncbi:S8 family serine peptidase [Candidatus Woesearchaeota archaeon]|nr:S8 family serine peptidase [Candidatus Woesearchaeota archaeon]